MNICLCISVVFWVDKAVLWETSWQVYVMDVGAVNTPGLLWVGEEAKQAWTYPQRPLFPSLSADVWPPVRQAALGRWWPEPRCQGYHIYHTPWWYPAGDGRDVRLREFCVKWINLYLYKREFGRFLPQINKSLLIQEGIREILALNE